MWNIGVGREIRQLMPSQDDLDRKEMKKKTNAFKEKFMPST